MNTKDTAGCSVRHEGAELRYDDDDDDSDSLDGVENGLISLI